MRLPKSFPCCFKGGMRGRREKFRKYPEEEEARPHCRKIVLCAAEERLPEDCGLSGENSFVAFTQRLAVLGANFRNFFQSIDGKKLE